MASLRIRQDGDTIQLIADNHVIEMPWHVALDVAQLIYGYAKQAEEIAKRDQVVRDHAILFRAGAGFGLTNNPVLQREAEHLAQYDRDLRRHMPGGIKSEERVGVPTVIQHPSRGGSNG